MKQRWIIKEREQEDERGKIIQSFIVRKLIETNKSARCLIVTRRRDVKKYYLCKYFQI